jgi:hypothetical protein
VIESYGGDDEPRTRDLCRDGHHDLGNQALTGSAKERNVLKTDRREFLLFPDCSSKNRSVGNSEPNRGRIGMTLKRLRSGRTSFEEEMRLRLEIAEIRLARKADGRVQHLGSGNLPMIS